MSVTVDPGIFKAYDVRAIYPTQINGEVARRVGRARETLPIVLGIGFIIVGVLLIEFGSQRAQAAGAGSATP